MAIELEDREMTLTEHLEDLRGCLIKSLVAVFLGAGVVWSWTGEILTWMAEPVGGLIFTAPTEAFFTRMKAALFGGALLALPVVLHQLWAFTARAMSEDLRRWIRLVVPASYLLFTGGVALCVFVVVPTAIRFLLAYGAEGVRPLLSVASYFEFAAGLSIAFGVVFQLPLVLLFLQRGGVVTREGLAEKRRYVYFAAFVFAAMLTPGPDVFSQLALACPMVLLFEVSLWTMRWTERSEGEAR